MGGGERDDATVTALPEAEAATPSSVGSSSSPAAAAAELPIIDPANYVVEDEHARGGIGRVVRARDVRLGRTVALKELISDGPGARARFLREALITARLQHPGIVPVLEAGRWPSGEPFYAMRLVAGKSLKEAIAATNTLEERLALLPAVIAVAETIAYAHSRGIVHRDLKPGNVMVGAFGEAVVIDWGLAKDLAASEDGAVDDLPSGPYRAAAAIPGQTVAGAVLGTPGYMPPEQARGEAVDERADVYSLGAMLYHLLAGVAPYTGVSPDHILARVIAEPPAPLAARARDAPVDLVGIVAKAMRRAPAERYASAAELAADLRRFQTGQLVSARHYSAGALFARWVRRHRAPVVVAAAAATILAVTGIVAVRRIVRERDVAAAARAVAETRANDLVLEQAQSALATDPTAALAWLKTYRPGVRCGRDCSIAADAVSRGVAWQVLQHGTTARLSGISRDGTLALSGGDGKVIVWDVASGRELGRFERKDMPVSAAMFLPDHRVVTQDETRAVVVWDPGSGAVRLLPGHAQASAVALSPDGTRVASAGNDGMVRVSLIDDDGSLASVEVGVDINGLVFSPDGARVAVWAESGSVTLIDRAARAARLLTTHGAGTTAAAFSPDGTLLASAANDGEVRLTSLGDGVVRTFIAPEEGKRLGFAANGALVSAGRKGAVRRWEIASGTELVLASLPSTEAVVFSADGAVMVATQTDGAVRLIATDGSGDRPLLGHRGGADSAALSRDGGTLVSTAQDGSVRIWKLPPPTGRLLGRAQANLLWLAWWPDGKRVAAVGQDAAVRVWDHAGGGEVVLQEEATVTWVHVSPDGRRVATASVDGTVRLWVVETGDVRVLRAHAGPAWRVLFSPTAPLLASTGDDGWVRLWDAETGAARGAAQANVGTTSALAFAPDGLTLATGGEDGLGKLWTPDADGLHPLAILRGHHGQIVRLRFSRDGTRLVTAGRDGEAREWRIPGGAPMSTAKHDVVVNDAGFLPDHRIVTAADDRMVRVWGDDGTMQAEYAGHSEAVWRVRVSPDGRFFASAGRDGTIRLWDVESGASVVFRGHAGGINAIEFSPDGTELASAGVDGSVRLWSVPSRISGGPRDILFSATTAELGNHAIVVTSMR